MMFGRKIEQVKILVADGNAFSRRLIRMMLTNVGVRTIHDATDGVEAIEAIQATNPDVMILNWDIPLLSVPELLRMIRSPDKFAKSDLPIIMVTDIAWLSRVNEAISLGAHEVLTSPMSPNMIKQRILTMLHRPRPMIRAGDHFVPMPREKQQWNPLLNAGARDAGREATSAFLI